MEMLKVQLIGTKTKVKKAIGPSKKKVTLTQIKDAYAKTIKVTNRKRTPEQEAKNKALKIKKITKFIADLKSAGYDKKTKTGPVLLKEMIKYKKTLEKDSKSKETSSKKSTKTSVKVKKESKFNIPKDLQENNDKKILKGIIEKSDKKFIPIKNSNVEMFMLKPEKDDEDYQIISVVLGQKYSASGRTKTQAMAKLLKQLEKDFE